ncbi:TetR/AcrR family transcriptional regulator [Chryseosolibacter indicus]|uniref:TetR/AcrR family transcriptional regulator n=1 Tax=Chryseosolibacter indicus TaxID=2782351 RepID=A0ABS5VQ29_9BACT|nr:TetR/AcrR family transcriptional regulator [Chryseosolibacter indicus]MBT1703554.1 TetR/AcrR family transcriptional regulator [Chryseosolibacter indicus]
MRVRDENKELSIRERAVEMLVAEGFDGLSMQKLAKVAGVSPATIYIYFKDRDDLIIQLWVGEMKRMMHATLEGFDPNMSFEEGLKVQWLNRAKFYIENPATAHFMEQIKYSPYYEKCRGKIDKKFLNAMGEFVHNAIKRKELVKLPLEIYWAIAFAPLYQLVKLHMSGRGMSGLEKFELDEKTMNQTLKLVIKALRP